METRPARKAKRTAVAVSSSTKRTSLKSQGSQSPSQLLSTNISLPQPPHTAALATHGAFLNKVRELAATSTEEAGDPESELETNAQYETRLTAITRQWEARAAIWTQIVSPERQALQRRFLWLLAYDDETRDDQFLAQVEAEDWSYGTASTYWSAVMKAMETVGMSIPPSHRLRAKLLGYMAKEEDPRRETQPMQLEQQQRIVAWLQDKHYNETCIALELAFTLGQRIGDVLKLQPGCATELHTPDMGVLLCVLFRRGKTTRRRQPFTLHIQRDTPLAAAFLQLQQLRRSQAPQVIPLMFDVDRVVRELKEALSNCDPSLCLLSIRKGGLQLMAISGATTSTLLHHSRHSSKEMLERYLGWGRVDLEAARQRFLGWQKSGS
jgi:hypothetical protein